MIITDVYERFKSYDLELSDPDVDWIPDGNVDHVLYDLWQAVKAAQAPCYWKETVEPWGERVWQAACGQVHVFITGTPTDNEMCFCPYCGRPLREIQVYETTET
jgi:hypothetical protein